MKLIDTSVLVYAVHASARHHPPSKRWLESALGGGAPVGFAWLALVDSVRLATNPAIFPQPLSPEAAMDRVDAWVDARSAAILQPGQWHASLMRAMLASAGHGGGVTNDAHLAALAREHNATVVTFDDDFERFPGVRTEQPH